MNVMTAFTLRSLKNNRVRSLVTILGVAMAAALLTGIITTLTSLNHYVYQSVLETSGSWTFAVTTNDPNYVETAASSEEISSFALVERDDPPTSDGEIQQYGDFVPLIRTSGNCQDVCAIKANIGREPLFPDEVMLPSSYRNSTSFSQEPLDLGTIVSLPVEAPERANSETGTQHTDDANASPSKSNGASISEAEAPGNETHGNAYGEIQTEEFTVVGFYDVPNLIELSDNGSCAISVFEGDPEGTYTIYCVMDDPQSIEQIEAFLAATFPDAEATDIHTSLLRYRGIHGDSLIWNTFGSIGAILAVIIIVACISLIYNAFGISVADRTRQFGLLSSVGASRRQLRRSVYLEALMVSAVGIPLGLLLGIGGTGIALAISDNFLRDYLSDAGLSLTVYPEWWALAFAAALTLVTVFISAWVPAHRAGRVSAIEAISRTRDIRDTRVKATSLREADPSRIWKPRGVGARVFGISGMLARLNRKRGRMKSLTASFSLGLAIVLLLSAGFLSTNLQKMIQMISSSVNADIGLNVLIQFPFTHGEEEDSDPKLMPQLLECFDETYRAVDDVPGAEGMGWSVLVSRPVFLEGDLLSPDYRDEVSAEVSSENNERCVWPYFVILNDARFRDYAEHVGLSAEEFIGTSKAVAVRTVTSAGSGYYVMTNAFEKPGSAELIDNATYRGQATSVVGLADSELLSQEGLAAFFYSEDGSLVEQVPLSDVQLSQTPFEIAAIVDSPPESTDPGGNGALVIPESSKLVDYLAKEEVSFSAGFDQGPEAGNDLASAMQTVAYDTLYETLSKVPLPTSIANVIASSAPHDTINGPKTLFDLMTVYTVNDYSIELSSTRSLVSIIDLFMVLFTVILTLIGLANVFNTITNGLILRQREFAVMRSIGMGDRAFNRMVTCESITYGLRGFIPGIVVAFIIGWFIHRAMYLSILGLPFLVPWASIGIAIALVFIIMVVSVAYGLRKAHTGNIVEALRRDIA